MPTGLVASYLIIVNEIPIKICDFVADNKHHINLDHYHGVSSMAGIHCSIWTLETCKTVLPMSRWVSKYKQSQGDVSQHMN